MYIYRCGYIYIYICMYACMYVNMYLLCIHTGNSYAYIYHVYIEDIYIYTNRCVEVEEARMYVCMCVGMYVFI
jgi:hypothetical protein